MLDTSAVLRLLDGESGGEQVEALFVQAIDFRCALVISAVNWGELASKLADRVSPGGIAEVLAKLQSRHLEVIPASATQAVRAGHLRWTYPIGYADCFGVELAQTSPDHILVTADYGVKPAEHLVRIQLLPVKPQP